MLSIVWTENEVTKSINFNDLINEFAEKSEKWSIKVSYINKVLHII